MSGAAVAPEVSQAAYYFVFKPRDLSFADAKAAVSATCQCSFRTTKGSAFFVRVTGGNIEAVPSPLPQGPALVIQPSTVMTDEIWAKRPQRRPYSANGRARREDTAPSSGSAPRAPMTPQPRYYSLYIRPGDAAVTLEDIYTHVAKTLAQPVAALDKFENDTAAFGFLRFATLDQARAARAAYTASPLGEAVVVKPAMPKKRRPAGLAPQ